MSATEVSGLLLTAEAGTRSGLSQVLVSQWLQQETNPLRNDGASKCT